MQTHEQAKRKTHIELEPPVADVSLSAIYPREQLDAALREIAVELFRHATMYLVEDEDAFLIVSEILEKRLGVDPNESFVEAQLAVCEAYAMVRFALCGPGRERGEDLRLRYHLT
jgi:hypothetical protein